MEKRHHALNMNEKVAFMNKPQVWVKLNWLAGSPHSAAAQFCTIGDLVNNASLKFIPKDCAHSKYGSLCDHQLAFYEETAFMTGPDTLEYALNLIGGVSFESVEAAKDFYNTSIDRGSYEAGKAVERLEVTE